jgi:VanZ family protein
MTSAQFRMNHWSAFAWAALVSITMGVLVEVAEHISGNGHCRLRDLIPDAVGIMLGSGTVFLWNRMRRTLQPS